MFIAWKIFNFNRDNRKLANVKIRLNLWSTMVYFGKTDKSSPPGIPWYLVPHGVQSISCGRVFDVCFRGKQVSQICIRHLDNTFERSTRRSEILFPRFFNKISAVQKGFSRLRCSRTCHETRGLYRTIPAILSVCDAGWRVSNCPELVSEVIKSTSSLSNFSLKVARCWNLNSLVSGYKKWMETSLF